MIRERIGITLIILSIVVIGLASSLKGPKDEDKEAELKLVEAE